MTDSIPSNQEIDLALKWLEGPWQASDNRREAAKVSAVIRALQSVHETACDHEWETGLSVCLKCEAIKTTLESELTDAEKLLQAWADPLPPNGDLYWVHVEKARKYFSHRGSSQETSPQPRYKLGDPVDCIYCGNLRGNTHADDCPRSAPKASAPQLEPIYVAGPGTPIIGHREVKAADERCGNWPCQLPLYHTGPWSSSPNEKS